MSADISSPDNNPQNKQPNSSSETDAQILPEPTNNHENPDTSEILMSSEQNTCETNQDSTVEQSTELEKKTDMLLQLLDPPLDENQDIHISDKFNDDSPEHPNPNQLPLLHIPTNESENVDKNTQDSQNESTGEKETEKHTTIIKFIPPLPPTRHSGRTSEPNPSKDDDFSDLVLSNTSDNDTLSIQTERPYRPDETETVVGELPHALDSMSSGIDLNTDSDDELGQSDNEDCASHTKTKSTPSEQSSGHERNDSSKIDPKTNTDTLGSISQPLPTSEGNSEVFTTQSRDISAPPSTRPVVKRERKVIKSRPSTASSEIDAEQAYHNLLDHNEPPPQELKETVVAALHQERMKAIMAEDYDTAETIDQALKVAYEVDKERQRNNKSRYSKHVVEARLQQARDTLAREEDEWNRSCQAIEAKQEKARARLLMYQDIERDSFEREWNSPKKLAQYNKPSPTLLQFRKLQKSMALTLQYDRAREMKVRVEEQTQLELQQAEERAANDMRIAFAQMEVKQQRELECFDEHERQFQALKEKSRQQHVLPKELAVKQLEAILNKDKPPNLKAQSVVVQPDVKTRPRTAMQNRDGFQHPSSNMTRAFVKYRKCDEAPQLGMQSLDVRKILGRRRPTTATTQRSSRSRNYS